MNKLDQVFKSGKKNLLNIYCTAGYPTLDSTGKVMLALQKHGADMIEIGMPYSDPIADGPVIQESNMTALQNGMNMHVLFEQLEAVKAQVTVPVILMGYLNPVLQFGVEKFCRAAQNAGVSAVIIPDLPMYVFKKEYRTLFKKHGLHFIFLVTPATSKKRIMEADKLSSGFIYAVSSSATTGKENTAFPEKYFKSLAQAGLKNQVMIGFGIKDNKTFRLACTYAAGGIIGSAYILAIKGSADIEQNSKLFIDKIIH